MLPQQRLFARSEAYPDLKANTTMMSLMALDCPLPPFVEAQKNHKA
jgi:hypothetical protein